MKNYKFIYLLVCVMLYGCYPSVRYLAPVSHDRPWPCNSDKFELPPHIAPAYQSTEPYIDKEHAYNLSELIDLAQRLNPDTYIAWEEAKQAAYAVGLAQANYLPQLTAYAVGGQQKTPLPVPKVMFPSGKINLYTKEVLPTLAIKWLLFDFGKRDCMVESARELSFASNVAFTQAHQKLIYDVSKAYFALDAEKAQLNVAKDALKNALILQDAAESRQERGLEKVTEVAIARRETAKARYDLEKAKADYNDAYYELLEYMGLTPILKLQIVDSSDRTLPLELETDVETYVCRALEQRPDIIEAFAKLRASAADICSAEASYGPSIEFDGFAYQNIGAFRINNHGPSSHINRPGGAYFINLSWPLYDGGVRQNNLDTARSKNAAAKEELIKTQDSAIRQVAKAYDTVKSTLAEYYSALAVVEAANVAQGSALESYHHGVGTFTDAVNTNTERTRAHSVLANARASVFTAAASLAFSTGELTSTEALDNYQEACNFPETGSNDRMIKR